MIKFQEGEIIQYWTILYKLPNKINGHFFWRCRCICGEEKDVFQQGLRNGSSGSCGCKSILKKRRLEKGEAAFNDLYYSYKFRAKNKQLEFTLTKEQFRELTSKNCIYCNKEPSHKVERPMRGKPTRYNGDYIYNSIDRIDNDQGYIYSNCTTACATCNKMRNNFLTVEEMKIAMKAVIEYREKQKHG